MDFLQILILALVQGLTEFLPVSSSAHLILVPVLTGWNDQGLAFDVAVHVGTLIAVVGYFRHDVINMIKAWCGSIVTRKQSLDSRMAWYVILGTIPAGLFGLFGKSFIENELRSSLIIATTTIVFGILLGVADHFGKRHYNANSLTWKHALIIGIAQAIALIPGTSRSGITMTAALGLGFTRDVAARFSFLLSIPLITVAGLKLTLDLVQEGGAVDWLALIMGVILSAVAAFLCIHFFLKFLEKIGMLPFVIYRLILGIALLIFFV